MSGRETNLTKNHTPDRIVVLKPLGDVKDSMGKVDNRLFSGENNLHAKMDLEYGHWYLQYESGSLPQPLQQRWTSFSRMRNFVTDYFKRRNVEIAEIKD